MKVIYKKSGAEVKAGEKFPAVLYYDRVNMRRFVIGGSPVEVTEDQYKKLKAKHVDDIVKYDSKKHVIPKMKTEHIKSIRKKSAKKVAPVKEAVKPKKPAKPKGMVAGVKERLFGR